jgi:hypothetical protein
VPALLKSLLLFVVFVASVYFTLVRSRAWHVAHYSSFARREYFGVCLGLALVLASVTSYMLRDEIVCPAGSSYNDIIRTETQTGKGGIGIDCRTEAGDPTSGSVFAGLIAWLGIVVLVFAGSSAVWRRLGPPAPPEPAEPPSETPRLAAPTDRRDRRKQRKRDQRDQQQRNKRS